MVEAITSQVRMFRGWKEHQQGGEECYSPTSRPLAMKHVASNPLPFAPQAQQLLHYGEVIVCEPAVCGAARHWGLHGAWVGHGRGAAACAKTGAALFSEELACRMPLHPHPEDAQRHSQAAADYSARVRLAVTAAFLAVGQQLRAHHLQSSHHQLDAASSGAHTSSSGGGGGASSSSCSSRSGSGGGSIPSSDLTTATSSSADSMEGTLAALFAGAGAAAAEIDNHTSSSSSYRNTAAANPSQPSQGVTATVIVQTGQLLTVVNVGSCKAVLDVGVARVELTEDDKLSCNEDEDERLSMSE